MRRWLVGGAVIEGPEGILLVQNQRRGGRIDWSPPGGVIDDGEDVLTGLSREVREETGLIVTRWEGPIYTIEATAPDLGWDLRVEAYWAVDVSGDLVLEDPDGIVVDAAYLSHVACCDRLRDSHPWVAEPLTEYLDARWSGTRTFGYHVRGTEPAELVVTRL